MSAQGTLTVKKQAGGENRFNEEIDAFIPSKSKQKETTTLPNMC